MKKRLFRGIPLIFASIIALSSCTGGGVDKQQEETPEETTIVEPAEEIATVSNPWMEVSDVEMAASTLYDFTAPTGVTNIMYQYNVATQMAEVDFALEGVNWTFRLQPSEEINDITGMYVNWDTILVDETTNATIMKNDQYTAYLWNDGETTFSAVGETTETNDWYQDTWLRINLVEG